MSIACARRKFGFKKKSISIGSQVERIIQRAAQLITSKLKVRLIRWHCFAVVLLTKVPPLDPIDL